MPPMPIAFALDSDTLRAIVIAAATGLPYNSTFSLFGEAYAKHLQKEDAAIRREQTRVVNSDRYSEDAWHILNTSHYTALRRSKQYDAASDAFDERAGDVEEVGKTIVLSSGDRLQAEVINQFQYDPCLVDAMCGVSESMEQEECVRAGRNVLDVGKGTLLEKMRWLRRRWKECYLGGEEDLDIVIEALELGTGFEEERYREDKDGDDEVKEEVEDEDE
ncbi:hypothetical protein DOTSEDRAFT_26945 [Dothistroma septosporum NZE10]|uniref:Uncharacterized protein n=1 Tax=Dothistroma septosporum (strain NZE10 / CBS 128990) TaxID=675120 RepID=N1PKJ7_DOTSN|nr:hypothetical protein DOTSEDRAFT_26945 [Dothistroma septosporum NZE10]